MSYRIGDIVTLKSGSPRMTISGVAGDVVSCSFFRNGEIISCDLPVDALEPLSSPKPKMPSLWSCWLAYRN
ncbi:YodC family protein [Nitrobacteraceae bacterium UC4446_H13]